ncbi:uncharacterized protein [Clytia hemisphaerica]|uniref:Uncharacterized protein n=1 Tax=Clytia hemisphaerica TaxID=252671 RepID=A0A7M6DRM2_9CNID
MSDNNSGKNDLKRKRIGKNGPYEKSLAYITDGRMRRAKEKAKLGQLEKVVYEISLLTKTPVAVMALNSYSQIWIAGTTDKMTEFVSNEELQSKFEMAAKGDSEPYYNFQKKRPTQNIVANEQVDSEQEEFDFPVDWAKFNTLKKRVLVRNLVRWYTETWKPWIPSLKPEWWPDDISFRSTRKSDVSSLDKILNSFLKFRATSSMALFQASDLPVSSEQWAELNWEDFDFPKNWLAKNWSPPKTPIKKNLVSLRHRCLVADTDLEPVRLLTSAECISFALFHDKKFWPFIKLVTITSCLSHIDVLVEWMTNGIGNINQEVIRNLFGSSNLTQLKSNILERTQDSSKNICTTFFSVFFFSMTFRAHFSPSSNEVSNGFI